MVKYQRGICDPKASDRTRKEFAEAWLDMKQALKEMEAKK